MPGGRPPKPLEVKRRTGVRPGRDSGGRKLPELASVTALPGADGVPPMPAELKTAARAGNCPDRDRDNGECEVCKREPGAAAWRRLWTAGQTWLSPATDLDVMTMLCRAYDEQAHHERVLEEDGRYVKGQRGGLVAHPAVAMLRGVQDRITRWHSQCGFTPSDRGRLGVGEVRRAATPLEELLARRAAGGQSTSVPPGTAPRS
jgi:P27 family predicted phage terminase small subunit